MRRPVISLILFALMLNWVVPVRSYTLQYGDGSANVRLHWPTMPIRVALSASLNSPQSNIKAGSDVEGAARRALARWQEAASIQFEISSSALTQVSSAGSGDGVSLITVAPQQEPNFFDGGRTGRTRVFYDPVTGAITEADIGINPDPSLQFSTDGTNGTYDLESVFTHEIGHLLGLEHSGVIGATMQPRQGQNGLYSLPALTPRTLSDDDRAGVRAIYGPHTGMGAITGRLLNGNTGGGPLFGAHVWAENVSTGRVTAANITLPDGTFRVDSLPPAHYRLIAEYLDGPILASEIASTGGAYGGIGSQPSFSTTELESDLTVASNATAALGTRTLTNPPPSLNPRLFGLNFQLSTIAVPMTPGNTYTLYVAGEGMAQMSSAGVNITSPYFSINHASFTVQNFGGNIPPVISFEVTVSRNATIGDYSIRLLSTTGELAYVSGGLTIDDGQTGSNPIDDAQTFVRQQYLDFLGREPDAGGLGYWTSQITQCGNDAACIHKRRVEVSAAFFIESEFQETGYYIYRIYKASYGRRPTFGEFIADRPKVVAGPNLDASKQAFADEFVTRADFLGQYPASLTPEQYVDRLNANTGASLTQAERDALVAGLKSNPPTETRATVLRKVAENVLFRQVEYNRAFVLMPYFGYLRRDPEEGGYQFWLNVLNTQQPSNFKGMVCAFITSAEYQLRFGPVVTRSDRDCAQYGP